MTIRLNGEPFELDETISIAALLERLGINPQLVAVEYNQSVIKRARYGETIIEEGSEVEIVNFVGGGAGRRQPRVVQP
jgi:sulfur carrier protein